MYIIFSHSFVRIRPSATNRSLVISFPAAAMKQRTVCDRTLTTAAAATRSSDFSDDRRQIIKGSPETKKMSFYNSMVYFFKLDILC